MSHLTLEKGIDDGKEAEQGRVEARIAMESKGFITPAPS